MSCKWSHLSDGGPVSEPAVARHPTAAPEPMSPSARSATTVPGSSISTHLLAGGRARGAAARPGELPELVRPRKVPPGLRVVRVARHLGVGVGGVGPARPPPGPLGVPRAASRAGCGEAAEALGPDLHQARPDHLVGRGHLPRGAGRRVQEVPRPGAARAVRRRARGSSRRTSAGRSTTVFAVVRPRRPLAAASIAQVHARHAASPASEVVVKVQRPPVGQPGRTRTSGSWRGWRPYLVGRIPIAALANPPALVELFAETITEELDFRLEAENMLDIARVFAELGQRGLRRPPARTPTLVTPPGAGDGAARRASRFDDVAGMQAAGIDTEAVVRTGMIGVHGGRACSTASSTATCTAGTCSCCPTAASRCSTSASPAGSTSRKRLAFLRLLIGGIDERRRAASSRRSATSARCPPTPTSTR